MDPSTIIAVLLFSLGLLLLLHHGYKHARDDEDADDDPVHNNNNNNNHLARQESCIACCYFQISDISNHETWILLCFTNALTILLMHDASCG
jgi:hypothetical protein